MNGIQSPNLNHGVRGVAEEEQPKGPETCIRHEELYSVQGSQKSHMGTGASGQLPEPG